MTDNSSLTSVSTLFKDNAGSQGGAIAAGEGCQLTFVDSSFHGNSAQNGGALYTLQCAPPGPCPPFSDTHKQTLAPPAPLLAPLC